MARSKSIPGSKPKTTKTANETNPTVAEVNPPEVKAVAPETATINPTPVAETAAESKAPVESRKMEVVKNGTRKNVVPINLDDEIRRRAYEIYQQRKNGSGSEAEDWLAAEREVRKRYHQQSA